MSQHLDKLVMNMTKPNKWRFET